MKTSFSAYASFCALWIASSCGRHASSAQVQTGAPPPGRPLPPACVEARGNRCSSAFPDLTFTVDDLLADGNKITVRWTARGTHKGALMDISPTGKEITTTC